jgi:hypothetical protein
MILQRDLIEAQDLCQDIEGHAILHPNLVKIERGYGQRNHDPYLGQMERLSLLCHGQGNLRVKIHQAEFLNLARGSLDRIISSLSQA